MTITHARRKRMNALKFLFAAAVATAAFALPAAAQSQAPNWPVRPVKFILPLGAGSGADLGARLLAEKLSARWGQGVVVENRPGGDGFVAITSFISSNDDHTLFMGPASSFTAHPYLHEKLPYKMSDLAPVARVSATVVTLNVPPSLNAKTWKDVVAMAKAQPGKLNWATITGATDLIFAAWLKRAGLDMVKVPYRNPVAALTDVAEGRLHVYSAAYAIVRPQIQAGRVQLMAVTSSEPVKTLPNVPTIAQAGSPELTFDGLVGIFGQRDMPIALRERIAADVKTALSDPALADKLTASGQEVIPGSAAEFSASIDQQFKSVAEIAKTLGIKAAGN
jgi:tripartite-type tricarboxylate transporter receptor subunit TctC